MRSSAVLVVVLGALGPIAADQTDAARPADALKSLREGVLRADRLKAREQERWDAKGEAYEKFFRAMGQAGLRVPMKDPDTGIALQAAWEVHNKLVKEPMTPANPARPNRTYDRGVLGGFLAFLKERTEAPVPGWWADSIVSVDVAPGQYHEFPLLYDEEDGPKRRKAEAEAVNFRDEPAGLASVPEGAELERRGGDFVYSAGGRSVMFPWDTFAADAIFMNYTGLLGEKRSVVAAYADCGHWFYLAGFEGKGGKPVWRAAAWASGRTHHFGQPYPQGVELTVKGDTVYAFASDQFGMQLEAFDLATGECRFRFCTSYWGHSSEKWGLK